MLDTLGFPQLLTATDYTLWDRLVLGMGAVTFDRVKWDCTVHEM